MGSREQQVVELSVSVNNVLNSTRHLIERTTDEPEDETENIEKCAHIQYPHARVSRRA